MTWEQMRRELKRRREHLRWSQRHLADLIGTKQPTISDWELGVYVPSVINVVVWAQALGFGLELEDLV